MTNPCFYFQTTEHRTSCRSRHNTDRRPTTLSLEHRELHQVSCQLGAPLSPNRYGTSVENTFPGFCSLVPALSVSLVRVILAALQRRVKKGLPTSLFRTNIQERYNLLYSVYDSHPDPRHRAGFQNLTRFLQKPLRRSMHAS